MLSLSSTTWTIQMILRLLIKGFWVKEIDAWECWKCTGESTNYANTDGTKVPISATLTTSKILTKSCHSSRSIYLTSRENSRWSNSWEATGKRCSLTRTDDYLRKSTFSLISTQHFCISITCLKSTKSGSRGVNSTFPLLCKDANRFTEKETVKSKMQVLCKKNAQREWKESDVVPVPKSALISSNRKVTTA